MKLLSIDPGLDLVATALWDWQKPGQPADTAIRQVRSFETHPTSPIVERLMDISQYCYQLCKEAKVELAIIERPNRGAAYDRNVHKAQAVMGALYWSGLAAGAIILGCGQAGKPVELLIVGTVKKSTKQAIARSVLLRARMAPEGIRRKVWNEDELDAVAVGMQAMSDAGIARIAFPPERP